MCESTTKATVCEKSQQLKHWEQFDVILHSALGYSSTFAVRISCFFTLQQALSQLERPASRPLRDVSLESLHCVVMLRSRGRWWRHARKKKEATYRSLTQPKK